MNTPATKPTSITDKVIAIVLVVWLLFFGGFGTITRLLKPNSIAPIATTIGQGAQQLLATAQSAPSTIDTRAIATPARAAAPAAASRPLVAPAAPAATAAPAAKALTATVAPAATLTPLVAAQAPAAAPAALGYAVPSGQHTAIHPDGSFTIDDGKVRYYPNSESVIVEVRVEDTTYEQPGAAEGAPPEQKIFLDPNDAEDAAALQAIPTATPSSITPCAGRHGCPKP